MLKLQVPGFSGETASQELFGANFLATRDRIDDNVKTDELIDVLGVENLRYPGGSLTENHFDITDPDSDRYINVQGNENEFVPISDFFDYAAAEDKSVTIVVPTRNFLSKNTDINGDRYASVPAADLREFVRDVLTGKYGIVDIDAFEIGNEYWGSGNMSAVEYGRLSSKMAKIISNEIHAIEQEFGASFDTEVIVQTGTNHAYSNLSKEYEDAGTPLEVLEQLSDVYGYEFDDAFLLNENSVNWRMVNDQLIRNEFTSSEYDAVDGVVTHLYSVNQKVDGHRDFALSQIEKTWETSDDTKSLYVTEWNSSAKSHRLDPGEDYGLHQAHEMINIVEAMMETGVDQAHVWAMLHNTNTALAIGDQFNGLSPAGKIFQMMEETLPGKSMLDFAPTRLKTTEYQTENMDVHGFYGDGEVVLYVVNDSEKPITQELDLTSMIESGGDVLATTLGVAEGQAIGATTSTPVLEEASGDEVFGDGHLVVVLDPGEIMEVQIRDFQPTVGFAETMAAIDGTQIIGDATENDDPLMTEVLGEDFDKEAFEEEEQIEDDSGSGMAGLLGALPLLLLLGLLGGGAF